MIRTIALTTVAAAMLCTAAPAQAATIGDVFDLFDKIKKETAQRCPKAGKDADMAAHMAAVGCQAIDMEVAGFGIRLGGIGLELMNICIENLKAGKGREECPALNENVRKQELKGDDAAAFEKLRASHEKLIRTYPIIWR